MRGEIWEAYAGLSLVQWHPFIICNMVESFSLCMPYDYHERETNKKKKRDVYP